MNSVAVFSPAKLNLFLAVTGRRPDGFHDLLSLAVKVDWGDKLKIEKRKAEGGNSIAEKRFQLECTDPRVPVDESNLVLKTARAFCAATGWTGGAKFVLEKRIPMGAGLGGGSSNAVAALRGLNQLAGEPLGREAMAELAAQIGSDCPLFLHDEAVVVRGRGEIVQPLGSPAALARLRGRRLLIFKPDFGISTAAAYAALAGGYLPTAEAEGRLTGWLNQGGDSVEALLFNSFERVAFAKYLALPTLLDRLRRRFGLSPLMTGSGSACFAIFEKGDEPPVTELTEVIRRAWGPSALVVTAAIA